MPAAPADPAALLRPGLLEGIAVVLAGDASSEALAARLAGLGAEVAMCRLEAALELELDEAAAQEQAVEAAAAASLSELGGEAAALLVDGEALAARPGGVQAAGAGGEAQAAAAGGEAPAAGVRHEGRAAQAGREALLRTLQLSWAVTRAVAGAAFLPERRGGRVVLLAPGAGGGEHAGAAVAGLENLARTLATEWARYAVTTVALAPGATEAQGSVETVLAYLLSPAGSYFSGTLLDLRGVY